MDTEAKKRVPRTPEIHVGKEVTYYVSDSGIVSFYATLTQTVDAEADVPIGRVSIPDGYALLVWGAEALTKKHLFAGGARVVTNGEYLSFHVINVSPDLRYIYNGESIAKGMLIKYAPKFKVMSEEGSSK